MITNLPATTILPVASFADAFERQQRLVAAAMDVFADNQIFSADVGVVPGLGRPQTTAKVESVLAQAFGAQDAAFVQGAGTGAIRSALQAGPWHEGDRRLLIHAAPIYSTTAVTFSSGMVDTVEVDFNDPAQVAAALAAKDCPQWVYVQHTRQQISDSYSPAEIIALARSHGRRVIVDDNYAVLRTPRIGVELGASASAFSLFKLHGPEGVGIVVGDTDIVNQVRIQNYSGGGQVQGHQAMRAFQALVEGCLNWAQGGKQTLELVERLQSEGVPGILDAKAGNLQDLCALVLLDGAHATEVRRRASELGAATYPVGSNSRYEVAPMVYRMSGSSLAEHPELAERTLRVNPMRASSELVFELLRKACA